MALFDNLTGLIQRAVDALVGLEDLSFDEVAPPTATLQEVIEETKAIPADDKTKKLVLSRYFQSEEGSGYSKEERRAAYDELLGRNRNSQLQG